MKSIAERVQAISEIFNCKIQHKPFHLSCVYLSIHLTSYNSIYIWIWIVILIVLGKTITQLLQELLENRQRCHYILQKQRGGGILGRWYMYMYYNIESKRCWFTIIYNTRTKIHYTILNCNSLTINYKFEKNQMKSFDCLYCKIWLIDYFLHYTYFLTLYPCNQLLTMHWLR